MNKNTYKNLAFLGLAIVTYGFVSPYLISSKSNELLALGVILTISVSIILINRVINQLN